MPNNKTITINGRRYDAVTGLPVKPEPRPVAARPVTRPQSLATDIHAQPQRSKTLKRTVAKKPVAAPKHPTRGRAMDIATSSRVQKFAPHPVAHSAKPAPADRAPQQHPVAARALARQRPVSAPVKAPATPPTGQQLKQQAVAKALSAAPVKTKPPRQLAPWKKRLIIIGLVIISMLGAGYAVYRFVPSVSVSIAASQAGVSARYPDYVPDGFTLHHPVTYSEGEVVLTFTSNSNDDSYTITQSKSTWDSSAVFDSVVKPAAGENYETTKERGLTIYTYDTNATWVNGGVLYTITSNAHLSKEQIRRIATSL